MPALRQGLAKAPDLPHALHTQPSRVSRALGWSSRLTIDYLGWLWGRNRLAINRLSGGFGWLWVALTRKLASREVFPPRAVVCPALRILFSAVHLLLSERYIENSGSRFNLQRPSTTAGNLNHAVWGKLAGGSPNLPTNCAPPPLSLPEPDLIHCLTGAFASPCYSGGTPAFSRLRAGGWHGGHVVTGAHGKPVWKPALRQGLANAPVPSSPVAEVAPYRPYPCNPRGYEFCHRGALEHSGRSCRTDGSGVTLRTCWSANPQVGFREMLVDYTRSHSPLL